MKRFAILAVFALAFMVVPARAQHTVSLSWGASSDAVANPNLAYNVYRLVGPCPIGSTPSFTKITAAPVSGLTFTDSNAALGQVCYYVTSTLNGAESAPSNTASGVVLPGAPTLLKITGTT